MFCLVRNGGDPPGQNVPNLHLPSDLGSEDYFVASTRWYYLPDRSLLSAASLLRGFCVLPWHTPDICPIQSSIFPILSSDSWVYCRFHRRYWHFYGVLRAVTHLGSALVLWTADSRIDLVDERPQRSRVCAATRSEIRLGLFGWIPNNGCGVFRLEPDSDSDSDSLEKTKLARKFAPNRPLSWYSREIVRAILEFPVPAPAAQPKNIYLSLSLSVHSLIWLRISTRVSFP